MNLNGPLYDIFTTESSTETCFDVHAIVAISPVRMCNRSLPKLAMNATNYQHIVPITPVLNLGVIVSVSMLRDERLDYLILALSLIESGLLIRASSASCGRQQVATRGGGEFSVDIAGDDDC